MAVGWMTTREVQRQLGVSRKTVIEVCGRHGIRTKVSGRNRLYSVADIRRVVADSTPGPGEIFARAVANGMGLCSSGPVTNAARRMFGDDSVWPVQMLVGRAALLMRIEHARALQEAVGRVLDERKAWRAHKGMLARRTGGEPRQNPVPRKRTGARRRIPPHLHEAFMHFVVDTMEEMYEREQVRT